MLTSEATDINYKTDNLLISISALNIGNEDLNRIVVKLREVKTLSRKMDTQIKKLSSMVVTLNKNLERTREEYDNI